MVVLAPPSYGSEWGSSQGLMVRLWSTREGEEVWINNGR